MEMGNRMHTKMHTNGLFNILNNLQVIGITGMAGVAQLVELWIVIPMLPSDISDLSPKSMHTNAYKWLECIRDAYKLSQ